MPARPPRLGFLAPFWAAAPRARRARWARLALIPALVLAAGCQNGGDDDDDDPTGPSDSIDGTYELTEFGERDVPFEAQTEDGRTLSVRSGRLTLDDGSYVMTFDVRLGGQRLRSFDDQGTYPVRDDDDIRFSSSNDAGDFRGGASRSRVDIDFNGLFYAFERD